LLGLVEPDRFGPLAAARAAPDRLLDLFQGARRRSLCARLAGPALRDVLTVGGATLAVRSRDDPSATPSGASMGHWITGKMGRLEPGEQG